MLAFRELQQVPMQTKFLRTPAEETTKADKADKQPPKTENDDTKLTSNPPSEPSDENTNGQIDDRTPRKTESSPGGGRAAEPTKAARINGSGPQKRPGIDEVAQTMAACNGAKVGFW